MWNLKRFLLFQPGTRCQSNRKCGSSWNRQWSLFWRPVQLLLQLRHRIVSITHFINPRMRNYLPFFKYSVVFVLHGFFKLTVLHLVCAFNRNNPDYKIQKTSFWWKLICILTFSFSKVSFIFQKKTFSFKHTSLNFNSRKTALKSQLVFKKSSQWHCGCINLDAIYTIFCSGTAVAVTLMLSILFYYYLFLSRPYMPIWNSKAAWSVCRTSLSNSAASRILVRRQLKWHWDFCLWNTANSDPT